MANRKSGAYYKLRKALRANLEARGLVEEVYTDKVEEYMDLWEHLKNLQTDIKERGYTIMDKKRGMEVENRSVSLALQTSRQMLAIFTALGFKDEAAARRIAPEEEDEL